MNSTGIIERGSTVSRTLDCESGAQARDFKQRQYGRRVEVDRSWTVYHVFSGIPAHVEGAAMTGLTRAAATQSMLALNLCNARRQTEWSADRPFASTRSQTQARCS